MNLVQLIGQLLRNARVALEVRSPQKTNSAMRIDEKMSRENALNQIWTNTVTCGKESTLMLCTEENQKVVSGDDDRREGAQYPEETARVHSNVPPVSNASRKATVYNQTI